MEGNLVMDNFDSIFNVMFTIVPIFIGVVFIFIILMSVSPKFRGKMMSRQVKATKHMVDYSKEDLKDISDGMAYASHDGIRSTARAIKEGFEENPVYCKHCGAEIDSDSKFCNKCGKEQ